MNNSSNRNGHPTLAPIYLQLREIIRNSIEDGDYLPGTAIPSENELADYYGINRITVRNAVDALVQEGLLKRIQGKGVFVVGAKLEQELGENEGFITHHNHQDGLPSITQKSKVLRSANEKYADLFDINPDDNIHHINRFIYYQKELIAIENVFVPEMVLPKLTDIDSTVFKMIDIFSFYNVIISGKRQSIEIVLGDEALRKQLNVPDDVAIVLLETWYQNELGKDIMYTEQWMRSDQTSFTIEL